MKRLIACAGLLCLLTLNSSARMVTLMVQGNQRQDTLLVQTNESFKVVSARDLSGMNMSLRIERQGAILQLGHNQLVGWHPSNDQSLPMNPIQMMGPALLVFLSNVPERLTTEPAYVTLEITPEPYPADKALVIPQGTVGAVGVESSTNLSDWIIEWSRPSTNTTVNRFYRIRLDKVP